MWKRVVYAEEEGRFFHAWTSLCEEFSDQEDILKYLQSQYISVYHQWAQHVIRRYLNHGQTTTSQSESSNHCIKTYLVGGKCNWYSLIKALREMVRNHKKNYEQLVAQGQARIRQRYVRQEYLGDLRYELTRRALDLINKERILAIQAFKEASCADALPAHRDEDCTTWLQYRIPCLHTILDHIKDGEIRPLTVEDVDKRWLSDSRVDENHPYLRIQDPPAAEASRGRPRNQPIKPASLPPGLQILLRPGRTVPAQRQPPREGAATPRRSQQQGSQSGRPRPRSGHRARSGAAQPTRRLAGSTQRLPSSFETEVHSSPSVRVAQRRQTKKTTREVTRRVSKPTAVSRAVPDVEMEDVEDVEDVQEEVAIQETQEELPAQPILRKTRSGRVSKPGSKILAKARGEAYS
jgi:hypothetical protein